MAPAKKKVRFTCEYIPVGRLGLLSTSGRLEKRVCVGLATSRKTRPVLPYCWKTKLPSRRKARLTTPSLVRRKRLVNHR
jgi:hypothetical protein